MSGGLGNFFKKIIPIVTLICCLCLGITHIIDRNHTHNYTYLTTETIQTGTQESPQTITAYNFDFNEYMSNIDINILERATNKIVDIDTYQAVLDNFNTIWQNGYQFGDGVMTIANALILVIDTLILPINILLVPIRIISGILLTAMTLIGINITETADKPITRMFNIFLDKLNIPLIRPIHNVEYDTRLNNTTWYFDETMTAGISHEWELHFDTDQDNETWGYDKIRINHNSNNKIEYHTADNTPAHGLIRWVTVYENGHWVNNDYRTIYINGSNTYPQSTVNDILAYFGSNATQITNQNRIYILPKKEYAYC